MIVHLRSLCRSSSVVKPHQNEFPIWSRLSNHFYIFLIFFSHINFGCFPLLRNSFIPLSFIRQFFYSLIHHGYLTLFRLDNRRACYSSSWIPFSITHLEALVAFICLIYCTQRCFQCSQTAGLQTPQPCSCCLSLFPLDRISRRLRHEALWIFQWK